jgi:hypothetical protein
MLMKDGYLTEELNEDADNETTKKVTNLYTSRYQPTSLQTRTKTYLHSPPTQPGRRTVRKRIAHKADAALGLALIILPPACQGYRSEQAMQLWLEANTHHWLSPYLQY